MGLELAQATGLIGTSVLWQGQMVTLVGVSGTDAYLDTGVSSQVVPLSDLALADASARTIHRGTFTTPGVFRPQNAAVCSSEAPEVDPSLNACFDPSNPENLDEILRQAGSGDPTQQAEGRAALREAARRARAEGKEDAFNRRVQEALDQIGQEDLCVCLNAQQAYTEVQATLPPANPSNSGTPSENGTPRVGTASNPGAAPVASGNGGVSMPLGFGRSDGLTDDGVMPATFIADGVNSIGRASDGSVVISSDGSVVLGTNSAGVSSSENLPVVVSAASLPSVLTPFTLNVPMLLTPAAVGSLDAPRSPDTRWEAGFFQALFGPQTVAHPTSGIVSLLTNPTPEFAPKLYEVRRAVADVIRQYRATYGTPNALDRNAHLALNFRYDADRRRIAVSIDPMGRGRTSNSVSGGSEPSENPFDRFRGPFRSLSLFRIGSDDHIRGEDFGPIVAFVPVPMQYLQNIRLNDGVLAARSDGRATDRGIDRATRRDSTRDDRNGSQSGDREGRDSRGGRGDRERRDQQEDVYASLEESLDSVAA